MDKRMHRLLVIDADQESSMMVKEVFEKEGFRVYHAPTVEDACRLVQEGVYSDTNFDFVIFDSGLCAEGEAVSLLQRLQKIDAGLAGVLVTSESGQAAKSDDVPQAFVVRLNKPLSLQGLIECAVRMRGIRR